MLFDLIARSFNQKLTFDLTHDSSNLICLLQNVISRNCFLTYIQKRFNFNRYIQKHNISVTTLNKT